MIHILSKETIDKIAAGEVAERPESVVKELLDNAVDAGADSISVEIRGGGLDLIRITDNGCGIDKADVPVAFIRHATSKLETAEDIAHVVTMGFRGEALASIAAVSRTELITKTRADLTGLLYRVEFGRETARKEVGAPDGTTVAVRDFLQNIPVRRQFLKSAAVETAAMIDTVEKAAMARPDISYSLTVDRKNLLRTSGNGRLKDVIYLIYGSEVTAELLEIRAEAGRSEQKDPAGSAAEALSAGDGENGVLVRGYIGRPVLNRSRRDYEVFYVNGRHIQSELLQKAVEDAFAPFMMQHRFPLAILCIQLPAEAVDVNVHPRKTQIRFADSKAVYLAVVDAITKTLKQAEHIVEALPSSDFAPDLHHSYATGENEAVAVASEQHPQNFQPFEVRRTYDYVATIQEELAKAAEEPQAVPQPEAGGHTEIAPADTPADTPAGNAGKEYVFALQYAPATGNNYAVPEAPRFLRQQNAPYFKMIGQVFETYWIIEYDGYMYLIDQHAAHEKVNFERYMQLMRSHQVTSQQLFPPRVLTLTARESALLMKNLDAFAETGYEIEHAGDRDFVVRAVPSNLPTMSEEALLKDMISGLFEEGDRLNSEMLHDKIASMSCKAAVKGNRRLSEPEMRTLIGELLTLENPYACPHGRPTIARWSKTELDKIFKRIVS